MSLATAAALIIGNEILTGKIADKNLSTLATRLRRLGVRLVRAHTILDHIDTIATEVDMLRKSHTWVVTSGGVGPTHDDVTIEAVAKAFDRDVIVSEELETLLKTAYGERLTEGHLLMARVPRGARLVSAEDVPWPVVVCENVFVLPGVPEIFQLKMKIVEKEIGQGDAFHTVAVLVNADEGPLKPYIDRAAAIDAAIEVGSYPRWTDPEWRTKITFDGRDLTALEAARASFIASLPSTMASRVE